MAKAILVCKINSHQFEDRVILLDVPVKIGRSFKDDQSDSSNGYFDCKVLSRQHALLMYENGHFYVMDMRSSNGTFVNNIRLSKSGEESKLTEIFTNDILRFGSDILDKSRQVTQKCIIGKIRLFHPDGTDCGSRPHDSRLFRPTDSFEDLHTVTQSLQESLMREKQLEEKLIMVKTMISKHIGRSQSDLIRIFEDVKEELMNLYQERECLESRPDTDPYDKLASENVRLTRRIHELEREVDNRVSQISNLQMNNQTEGVELMTLKKACQLQKQDIRTMENKISQSQAERSELLRELDDLKQNYEQKLQSQEEVFNEEKARLKEQLHDITKNEINLLNKIQSLESDEDYGRTQIDHVIAKERECSEMNQVFQYKIDCLEKELESAYQVIRDQTQSAVVHRSDEDIEKISQLEASLVSVNKDMAYLKQELIDARAHKSASDDELSTVRGKLETLGNTISSLSDEGNRLRKIIARLEEDNRMLLQEADHMRSLVDQMEASSSHDEMNRVQLADLRSELAKRDELLKQRTDEAMMLKRDLRLKDETIQQLEIEISCLRGQGELDTLKEQLVASQGIEEANCKLIGQLESIQKEFAQTLQEKMSLAEELKRQQSLYSELKKMRGLSHELDSLLRTEQQLKEAQQKIIQLEAQLSDYEAAASAVSGASGLLIQPEHQSRKAAPEAANKYSASQAALSSIGNLKLYEMVLGMFFIYLIINWNVFGWRQDEGEAAIILEEVNCS